MASQNQPGVHGRRDARPCRRAGFTLVELLVVILIISALIIALIPVVNNALERSKGQAVATQTAAVQAELSIYAQNHAGNFPGVAIDSMSPLEGQALGDPELYDRPLGLDFPSPGQVCQALIGAEGHRNLTASALTQQIRDSKNTTLTTMNVDYPRYFDELIRSGAAQDYKRNPFSGFGQNQTQRNIFGFTVSPEAIDLKDVASLNDVDNMDCFLLVPDGGAAAPGVSKTVDPVTNRVWFYQDVPGYTLPLDPLTPFVPENFSAACAFGSDDGDYFSPGDFAYVPILSESAFANVDDPVTLRNEAYLWGTAVGGYLIFGYGAPGTPTPDGTREMQKQFYLSGLAGFGQPGIDTRYEYMVLQCFEGAVYVGSMDGNHLPGSGNPG